MSWFELNVFGTSVRVACRHSLLLFFFFKIIQGLVLAKNSTPFHSAANNLKIMTSTPFAFTAPLGPICLALNSNKPEIDFKSTLEQHTWLDWHTKAIYIYIYRMWMWRKKKEMMMMTGQKQSMLCGYLSHDDMDWCYWCVRQEPNDTRYFFCPTQGRASLLSHGCHK